MIWNDKTRNFLFNLRRRGRTFEACAETISEWFDEPVSAADVEAWWDEMTASGWVAKKRAETKRKDVSPFAGEDPALVRKRLMEANIRHLIDLKRAGHSPRRTEYRIAPEGNGVRFRMADTSSYLGSSSALCVEAV
jgi:hypothetical protein